MFVRVVVVVLHVGVNVSVSVNCDMSNGVVDFVCS